MNRWRAVKRWGLLVAGVAWVLTMGVGITACGKKEDPQAEGYYEGPMLPKSQRGAPTPAGGTE
ncbi:MAG: hypothetical protein K6U75_02180 [Firmicutes bacterium]|nr:hypothetical protein [Bacillota bacterium]